MAFSSSSFFCCSISIFNLIFNVRGLCRCVPRCLFSYRRLIKNVFAFKSHHPPRSHTTFTPSWDDRLIALILTLPPNSLLTAYPLDPASPRASTSTIFDLPLRPTHFGADGLLRLAATPTPPTTPPPSSGFVAAGFLFGPGHVVSKVPYDPHLDVNNSSFRLRVFNNFTDLQFLHFSSHFVPPPFFLSLLGYFLWGGGPPLGAPLRRGLHPLRGAVECPLPQIFPPKQTIISRTAAR
jgi:hypothetical protein